MASQSETAVAESIVVRKDDLVDAWLSLERLVVGLHRIGSHYGTSGPDVPLTAEHRVEMLAEIDRLIDPSFFRRLGKARVALSRYLPNDEAEALSDALDYYQPTGPSTKTS